MTGCKEADGCNRWFNVKWDVDICTLTQSCSHTLWNKEVNGNWCYYLEVLEDTPVAVQGTAEVVEEVHSIVERSEVALDMDTVTVAAAADSPV